MTDGFKIAKRLTADAEELIIRAQVQDADGGAFRAVTFEKSRIDYVAEIDKDTSGIALKTGARIAVRMPYEELEQKIYFSGLRDEPVLDLRDKTGPAAQGVKMPAPAQDFAVAAAPAAKEGYPAKKPFIDKPLKIAMFVRQSGQQNFQMCFVVDSNIDWSGIEGDDGKNGKITKIPLRRGLGPFGEGTLIIDMPRAAFMDIYNRAKFDGLDELDLRDWTRRRDPDNTKPPPPRAPEIG